MVNLLVSHRPQLDIAIGPPGSEVLMPATEISNQVLKPGFVRLGTGARPECSENKASIGFPVDDQRPKHAEEQSQHIALLNGKHGEVTKDSKRSLIPAHDGETLIHHVARIGLNSRQDYVNARRKLLPASGTSFGGRTATAVTLGETVEVLPLRSIEPQGLRDAVQHRVGHVDIPPLLK